MSEFAESRSGYPKFFRASPFADEVARNASPVPALLAIADEHFPRNSKIYRVIFVFDHRLSRLV